MKYKLKIENGTIKIKLLSGQAIVTSGFVTIIDADTGQTITTVQAGNNYSVLQFSGIDGGQANTVYTNSIVVP